MKLPLIVTGCIALLASATSAMAQCPTPPETVTVRAGDNVYFRLAYLDNTVELEVNGAALTRYDDRPPMGPYPPNAAYPVRYVRLNQVLNAGTNTLIIRGINERSIHESHATQNPWRLDYDLRAGPSESNSGPLFQEVRCYGREQGWSDRLVVTHVIKVIVN